MKKFTTSEIKALAKKHGVSRDAVRYAIRHDKLDKLGTGTSTRQKSSGMDLALCVMRSISNGWPCTLLDIAEVCGTSKEAIRTGRRKSPWPAPLSTNRARELGRGDGQATQTRQYAFYATRLTKFSRYL